MTPLSFDVSVPDIFWPLSKGATLILAGGLVPKRAELLAALTRRSITLMQATPATWQMLLSVGWTPEPKQRLLCAGEALAPDLARRLMKDGATLWNFYGPTEACVYATCSRVDANKVIHIGQPVHGADVTLLDSLGQPVAPGLPGELAIAGTGLARGYLNQAGLTAAAFVPNPLGMPGSRLYKSGDKARRDNQQQIRFLGRIDSQIKLRGYRIEPGEIEAVLSTAPGVTQAVVVLRHSAKTGKRLIAHVVPGDDQTNEPKLRQYLANHLPHYMIPSIFVITDKLPLTATGKVNRRALTQIALPQPAQEGTACITQLEKDIILVDLTDPRVGFPVFQVVVPGYSDILPYHPANSPVLFTGWTRDLPMGYVEEADGSLEPCTAQGFFPDW